MKKILLLIVSILVVIMPVSASTKKYIKNSKGQTTGYTKSYSNGTNIIKIIKYHKLYIF